MAADPPSGKNCSPSFLNSLLARFTGVGSDRGVIPPERISILSEPPASTTSGPQSKILFRKSLTPQDKKLGFSSLEYDSARGSWNHFPRQYSNVGNEAKVLVKVDGVEREVSGRILQEYKGVIDILDKEGEVHRIVVGSTEFSNFRVKRTNIEWRDGGNTIQELISEVDDSSYGAFVIARVPVNAEGQVISKQVGSAQRYEYISGMASVRYNSKGAILEIQDKLGTVHILNPQALRDMQLSGLVTEDLSYVSEFGFKAPPKLVVSDGFEARYKDALRLLDRRAPASIPDLRAVRRNLTPGLLDAIERASLAGSLDEKVRILRSAGLTQNEREALIRSGMCEH